MSKWQCVFKYHTQYRAEIVKAVLEEEGLSAVILNKQDTNYKLGHFEVCVSPDEIIPAMKIINDEISFE